ncbi:MAG: HAD-IA family hydrolase [Candidatus Omnitrophica bacterium]|nr:HAD-IA family hydrolase [Candidatus Omnitrophota bacterium]
MKQLIVYDLDGTLVDTLEDIAASANHMRAELGLPLLPARQIRGYIGQGLHELVRHCLHTEDPKLVEQGTKIYRRHYTLHLLDHSRLYPHAPSVLAYFKGRRQAVITNKPNPYSRDILTALGIADFFFDIIGGNSAYPKKPDPTSLLALMASERIDPTEALFVGDSPIDIETGRKAGVFTVTVTHGLSDRAELVHAQPDLLVSDFQEFLEAARHHQW